MPPRKNLFGGTMASIAAKSADQEKQNAKSQLSTTPNDQPTSGDSRGAARKTSTRPSSTRVVLQTASISRTGFMILPKASRPADSRFLFWFVLRKTKIAMRSSMAAVGSPPAGL